jgi:catalase
VAFGVRGNHGEVVPVDHALVGAPSVLFDALILLPSQAGAKALLHNPAAIDWIRDGFAHLKVIGYAPAAASLLTAAGLEERTDVGFVPIEKVTAIDAFIAACEQHRVWGRELSLRAEE